MRNWTIGRKLFSGVGVLNAVLVTTGILAITTAASMKDELDVAAQKTTRKIDLAHEIQEHAAHFRSEQRHALLAALANDAQAVADARQRLQDQLAANDANLAEIEPLLVVDKGRRAVADVRALDGQWRGVSAQVFELIRRGDLRAAWQLDRQKGSPLLDEIDARGDILLQLQRQFLQASVTTAEGHYARSRLILVACIVVSALLGAYVAFVVRGINRSLRETARTLREGAEQVAAASSQVAGAAQSLSQGATEQAASLEETSASMEELASMTRSNADRARRAASLMTTVETQLAGANAKLSDLVGSMSDIEQSSGRVAKIIKAIDEIAFQTNILALNAAVEAARAGEAGMGFAVVADEVRNLAQRAAAAARDTAGLIEASGHSAAQGAGHVAEVVDAIRRFSSSVSEVRSLSESVSTASDQQKLGIEQVGQAVAQMEQVTQTTAGTAEESAAASEELNAQAEASLAVVRKLAAMVGGGAAGRPVEGEAPSHPAVARVVAVASRPTRSPHGSSDEPPATGTFGSF
jgi:methyl-accepting chemotaxis protein/methyl-accepting chemotaxis protein-1 (serine sensor receptor)